MLVETLAINQKSCTKQHTLHVPFIALVVGPVQKHILFHRLATKDFD